ncbi:hypothetical protein [Thauera chlorobenzoica]|uniref:Uncharacterized protein n=1 Tax=Thauera chlorobenzoica TaxID=96773 RepID=A0A1H5XBA7_9RHOO|nr:hypothetical protein [Thauera chlorobenzoica]APR04739.1 hypothetical protein Tchl_1892 [Thauera chlorobenzoica]SEG08637.1 hypothetical protein SAMN05216242_11643 [Thauera chlorobenzoica]
MDVELEAAPAATSGGFGALARWQAMLDRHAELFTDMLPGSAVGFVARAGSGIQPGKHVAGVVEHCRGLDMMKWCASGRGMVASTLRFPGFEAAAVDLLFVADEAALAALEASLDGDALSTIKRRIRQGGILFFVLRTKYELQDAGYEDFLDTLGLAFLGACR